MEACFFCSRPNENKAERRFADKSYWIKCSYCAAQHPELNEVWTRITDAETRVQDCINVFWQNKGKTYLFMWNITDQHGTVSHFDLSGVDWKRNIAEFTALPSTDIAKLVNKMKLYVTFS